uniref:Uncharacterized protein n=1 Tax=Photinus pyralis TaxID=7054 RepID=A0A1Y1NC09_PHOPY
MKPTSILKGGGEDLEAEEVSIEVAGVDGAREEVGVSGGILEAATGEVFVVGLTTIVADVGEVVDVGKAVEDLGGTMVSVAEEILTIGIAVSFQVHIHKLKK